MKKEGKIFKFIRRFTSLGLAGTLLFLFPNVILTWISGGVGFIFAKGIINWATASTLLTFLGSQAGIYLQKGIITGLTYLFSSSTLKKVGKLGRAVSYGTRTLISKLKKVKTEISKQQEVKKELPVKKNETKIEQPKVEKKVIPQPQITQPIIEKPKVKTLGVHPSIR